MTAHNGRVLFMGTPVFAVPVLTRLMEEGFQVVAVCTQQDSPVGRKRVLTPPPVKVEALRFGLPVLQPKRVRDEGVLETIASLRPDVLVTCAYGQLLPKRLLSIPTVGSVNVHASLLPRWRGAAPIQRAIMAGDTQTGVSIMEMVQALDAGPVYGTVEVPILPTDEYADVHDKLSMRGAELLSALLPDYLNGKLEGVPQNEECVTYAHRIVRDDEWIDWNRPRIQVCNHIRGLSPLPGASTYIGPEVMKVWVNPVPLASIPIASPGTVAAHSNQIFVACQDAWLCLKDVQPAGKRRMAAMDWFRGMKASSLQFRVEGRPDEA